jgi:type IV pilus assembly protein PilV
MRRPAPTRFESGTTLVEVLVSVLILSLGMLSLSSMMAHAVQMPKLSGYRAIAANIAASHIERIRANRAGFESGDYDTASSYDASFAPIAAMSCEYPDCTVSSLATMDDAATKQAARLSLPAGGVLTKCDPSPCTPNSMGDIWIMWQEPQSRAWFDPMSSDICHTSVTAAFPNPRPRCMYVRFKP